MKVSSLVEARESERNGGKVPNTSGTTATTAANGDNNRSSTEQAPVPTAARGGDTTQPSHLTDAGGGGRRTHEISNPRQRSVNRQGNQHIVNTGSSAVEQPRGQQDGRDDRTRSGGGSGGSGGTKRAAPIPPSNVVNPYSRNSTSRNSSVRTASAPSDREGNAAQEGGVAGEGKRRDSRGQARRREVRYLSPRSFRTWPEYYELVLYYVR